MTPYQEIVAEINARPLTDSGKSDLCVRVDVSSMGVLLSGLCRSCNEAGLIGSKLERLGGIVDFLDALGIPCKLLHHGVERPVFSGVLVCGILFSV